MSDLIIAVTNSYNDTVTMVPVQTTMPSGHTAMFHSAPLVDFDGRHVIRNFDYHFDFRLKGNRFHKDLLPNRYFHFPRLKRMTQYIKLFHFNEQASGGLVPIFIPEFYTATQKHGEHVAITNFSLPKSDKVVIKEQFGARGSNQVVVPSNMVTTLLKHSKGLTMAEVKAKFPDLIYSEGTNMDAVFFNKPADLFMSELVPKVKNEWRLLVGGRRIYGRERMIKQGPYPQANLDHDVFPTVQTVNYSPIEEMFDKDLVDTLHAMVDFINLPLGSVDLFLTEDGRYGIFEYSTQFAFVGADNHFVRQLILDGMDKVLVDHGLKGKPSPISTVDDPSISLDINSHWVTPFPQKPQAPKEDWDTLPQRLHTPKED